MESFRLNTKELYWIANSLKNEGKWFVLYRIFESLLKNPQTPKMVKHDCLSYFIDRVTYKGDLGPHRHILLKQVSKTVAEFIKSSNDEDLIARALRTINQAEDKFYTEDSDFSELLNHDFVPYFRELLIDPLSSWNDQELSLNFFIKESYDEESGIVRTEAALQELPLHSDLSQELRNRISGTLSFIRDLYLERTNNI